LGDCGENNDQATKNYSKKSRCLEKQKNRGEKMNQKYELIESDYKIYMGVRVFRIRAKVDIARFSVRVGDFGGYIEKEENLSVSGDAWVHGNARVHGDARVYGNASVYGDAWVYGNARVHGDAWVYGNAWVHGNARVSGDASVHGDAWVYGNAWVHGNARVSGDARVSGAFHVLNLIGSRFNLTLNRKTLLVDGTEKKPSDWLSSDLSTLGLTPELEKAYKRLFSAMRKVQVLERRNAGQIKAKK